MSEFDNGCCTSPLVGEVANEQSEVAGEGYLATVRLSFSEVLFLSVNTPHPAFYADLSHKGRGKNTVPYNTSYILILWNYAHKFFPYEGWNR